MGKLYTLGLPVALAMALFSCSKEADRVATPPQSQSTSGSVLNVSINAGESYSYTSATATELAIHKQAAHFRQSGTSTNNETGQIVYTYAPAEGFSGTDEVVLSSIRKVDSYSSGCYRGSYGNEQDQMIQKIFTTVKIKVVK